jgi:hypothetical protein
LRTMRVFLQRLGHLSAETLNGSAVGGIVRWFGWLGVEALTKIGLKARRHRGHVVRISGIDLVAGWAKVRQRRRNRRPVHPERPIEMVFADPPRVVAPRAVPIASRPPAKPMSVQSMRSGSSYRPRAVNFCCSERCCNSRVALCGEGLASMGLSFDVPELGLLVLGVWRVLNLRRA